MKVRFRPAALTDLETIYDTTVEAWGMRQAEHYASQIRAAVDRLVDHPRSGHVYREVIPEREYRSIPSGRHLIFYTLDEDYIIVVRILHDRMDVRSKLLDDG